LQGSVVATIDYNISLSCMSVLAGNSQLEGAVAWDSLLPLYSRSTRITTITGQISAKNNRSIVTSYSEGIATEQAGITSLFLGQHKSRAATVYLNQTFQFRT